MSDNKNNEFDNDIEIFSLIIGVVIGVVGYYFINRYNDTNKKSVDDYKIYCNKEISHEKPR